MGIGPVPAIRKLLAKEGRTLADYDVVEINEAFAAQVLACTRELGLPDDADFVNPNGGAIALGHPLGASGARLCTTALLELRRRGARRALVSLCVGVGQGLALALERVLVSGHQGPEAGLLDGDGPRGGQHHRLRRLPAAGLARAVRRATAWWAGSSPRRALSCSPSCFAALSRAFPKDGGPYVYTHAAFGELAGFVVAWGYWVSVWVGNAAIATGAVSYTSAFAPWIARVPGASAVVTIAVVWLLTLVNCSGVRAVGWVQAVTTVLKLLPLVAVALVGGFYVRSENLASFAEAPLTLDGITGAADPGAVGAAWASSRRRFPRTRWRTRRGPSRAPRCSGRWSRPSSARWPAAPCCSSSPPAQLAASNAPFADVARLFWGEGAAKARGALRGHQRATAP